MADTTLMLLGAGQEQCIAIEQAKALGYRVVAVDGNPKAPGLGLADVGLVSDIQDAAVLIEIGRSQAIQGVFCHAVEIPEVVAAVASALRLPGLPIDVAHRCTIKSSRIAALRAAGIPVAPFATAHSEISLLETARRFGFPLIIKPTDNAGSRGVQMVNDEAALTIAYTQARRHSRSSEVLLERVLVGPQISTESVVWKGRVHTFAFADRNYSDPKFWSPYFIEDGINFPTELAPSQIHEVLSLVEKTIKVLGINFGAAKGDIIIHEGVPHVIEMACRTSGGWFGAGSIPSATGVNAIRPLLQMAVGDNPDIDCLTPSRNLGCAQRYWIPRTSGIFRGVTGLDMVRKMPGVELFNHFFPPIGTKLEKAQHHAQRYAQVICTAASRSEAIARAEAALACIKTEIEAT